MNDPPRFGFWPFVLPFLAFMLIGAWEPKFSDAIGPASGDDPIAATSGSGRPGDAAAGETTSNESSGLEESQVSRYLWIYGLKILLTTIVLAVFWRTYAMQFPVSMSLLSVWVGAFGVLLWVGVCHLQIESWLLRLFGWTDDASRSQFNPFDGGLKAWQASMFLGLRFFGLVLVVPVCEELFLRGFLMRIVQAPSWWSVRLSEIGIRALLVAPIYGLLTHPGEALAAVLWFSLVNWLMKRTGSFWDCVAAHAVTNLLLGLYIVLFSQWQLW